ncbi:MAG TPA: 23S rRNA (guanosine(2251)-2'-O)-methyltransferase RlmB [Sphingobacteriaceae bacterium]|nr:23S rRNA (guanosine(2251)-2'-O)-methyltransferase RlmB [Sphingobacteriaceae bacterium]
MPPDSVEEYIEGRQAVREALRAGVPLTWVRIARGARGPAMAEIMEAAREAQVPVFTVDRRQLDRLTGGRRHQGVVAAYAGFRYRDLADIIAQAQAAPADPFILLAAGILDPRNLGSLIRTAEGAGVHGVVIPRHRSALVTPTVIKASAGAALHMPVAVVANLSQAIVQLKEHGLWVVAADPEGEESLYTADLLGPIAVVVGGEGKGIPPLVRKHCDMGLRIPMQGRVTSLNAGVAGGLILYEIVRQRLLNGKREK